MHILGTQGCSTPQMSLCVCLCVCVYSRWLTVRPSGQGSGAKACSSHGHVLVPMCAPGRGLKQLQCQRAPSHQVVAHLCVCVCVQVRVEQQWCLAFLLTALGACRAPRLTCVLAALLMWYKLCAGCRHVLQVSAQGLPAWLCEHVHICHYFGVATLVMCCVSRHGRLAACGPCSCM